MTSFVEIVLMGVVATLFMDLASILLGKLKVIYQLIEPQVVGRWALYMFREIYT